MSDFHQTIAIEASAKQVFDFVSDVKNLPKYLPTVHHAEPQPGERVRVQGEASGHKYDSDGYFRVDRHNQKMEWGSDGENNYSGQLQVTGSGVEARVSITLRFDVRPELAKQMDENARRQGKADRSELVNEGIQRSLESIKNQMEGKGGKVEPASATQRGS